MWNITREETPRVAARLPEEPKRVANWLAGWVDYVFALTLVATRWLRPPSRRPEPALALAGFPGAEAPSASNSSHRAETSMPIRLAEIVMVLVSFFLGAQLLSGTPTVAAPDLSKLTLMPNRSGVDARPIPAQIGREVVVPSGTFVGVTTSETATETAAAAAPATGQEQEAAQLAPLAKEDASAAAVTDVASPVAQPTQPPAAVATTAPQPTATPAPATVAPAPPAPPVAARAVNPGLPDRYLTSAELSSAALAAGWSPALVPALQKVAWCESRYHTHAEYLGARGLMQVLPFWFDVAGLDFSMWADPVTNLRAALVAYNEHLANTGDGWSAWTCKP